jgi:hypothetical protein
VENLASTIWIAMLLSIECIALSLAFAPISAYLWKKLASFRICSNSGAKF